MTVEERATQYIIDKYGSEHVSAVNALKRAYIAGYEQAQKDTVHTLDRQRELVQEAYMVGYEKARAEKAQWHYVKDGDLPEDGAYLVVWQNGKGYKEIFLMNYEEDDEEVLHWLNDDYEIQDEHVIAWCELPEVPEEK